MSASLSTLAAPAAPLAQLPSGTDAALAADTADSSAEGPFAALFLQALGKQIAVDLDPKLLNLAGDVAQTVAAHAEDLGAEAEDALAALLPFLEGMGLVPPEAAAATPLPLAIPVNATNAPILDGLDAAAVETLSTGSAAKSAVAPLLDNGPGLAAALPGEKSALAALPATPTGTGMPAASQPSVEGGDQGFATQLKAALEPASPPGTPSSPAQAGGTTAPAAAITAPVQSATSMLVAQPVGASGWSEAIGNHVVLMSNRLESRAELVLTPPQMGRVEVSLSVSGDQASASFVSANPVVREALEAAMPRLREILAEAGIQLGQAQVGAENSRQTAQQEKNGDNFPSDQAREADGTPRAVSVADAAANALKPGRGLVDVFA